MADFLMTQRSVAGLLLVVCLRCMSPAHAFIQKCPADGAQAQECTGAMCLQSRHISVELSDVVPSLTTFRHSVRRWHVVTLSTAELTLVHNPLPRGTV